MSTNEVTNAIIIITITFFLLIVVIIIVIYIAQTRQRTQQAQLEAERLTHQQTLRASTQEAQEQTLSHVASELHDDIGVMLSTVKLFLAKANETDEAPLIAHSKELLDESIQKIRDLSHQLHPATLQRLGLVTAIESMLNVIDKAGIIRCRFEETSMVSRLAENIELSLYRIIQELINNLIKHGQVKNIVVNIGIADNLINILLEHDGQGLTQEQFEVKLVEKGALGLKNISNRLELLQGDIHLKQLTNKNYQVIISSPIDKL